ncbi:MAG: DUF4296 domain-containing protein [Rikenellaceae bacterium]
MKKYFYILLLLLSMGGCRRREAIPDATLVNIFHDLFLINAYHHHFPVGVDTLQIYAPVLDKYGYSVDDVNYTIGNFSKRKSARLSEVVEQAITKLEAESKCHKAEVTILDSIDAIARRRASVVLYRDSLITMREQRDTSKMKIVIDDIKDGDYTIKFDYLVDSVDRNNLSYRTLAWFERSDITSRDGSLKRFKQHTSHVTKHKVSSYKNDFTGELLDSTLNIRLVEWRGDLRFKPHVTIKNLEVIYTPPTHEAVEKMYEQMLNTKILSPKMYEL